MAIGTPVSLGSNTSTGTGLTSLALSIGSAIAVGDLVIVAFHSDGATAVSATSVTDPSGNTYQRAAQSTSGTYNFELWYAFNCAAVASGNITVTWTPANSGGGPSIMVAAARVTGISLGNPLDKTATQAATTTTPTVSTGTLSQAIEIVIGGSSHQGGSYSQSSGFSSIATVGPTNGDVMNWSYQIVAATTSVTYAPTWGVSLPTRTFVASFKGQQVISMTANPGSYALTGASPTMGLLYRMIVNAGSYAISGAAVTFQRATRMSITAGSYAITGVAAVIGRSLRMATVIGSYALTGAGANKFLKIKFEPGSYAITGISLIGVQLPGPAAFIRNAAYVLQKLRVTAPKLDQ